MYTYIHLYIFCNNVNTLFGSHIYIYTHGSMSSTDISMKISTCTLLGWKLCDIFHSNFDSLRHFWTARDETGFILDFVKGGGRKKIVWRDVKHLATAHIACEAEQILRCTEHIRAPPEDSNTSRCSRHETEERESQELIRLNEEPRRVWRATPLLIWMQRHARSFARMWWLSLRSLAWASNERPPRHFSYLLSFWSRREIQSRSRTHAWHSLHKYSSRGSRFQALKDIEEPSQDKIRLQFNKQQQTRQPPSRQHTRTWMFKETHLPALMGI